MVIMVLTKPRGKRGYLALVTTTISTLLFLFISGSSIPLTRVWHIAILPSMDRKKTTIRMSQEDEANAKAIIKRYGLTSVNDAICFALKIVGREEMRIDVSDGIEEQVGISAHRKPGKEPK